MRGHVPETEHMPLAYASAPGTRPQSIAPRLLMVRVVARGMLLSTAITSLAPLVLAFQYVFLVARSALTCFAVRGS